MKTTPQADTPGERPASEGSPRASDAPVAEFANTDEHKHAKATVSRRCLCVWFADWPIQRVLVQRRRESSADRPIVLWSRDPRAGRLVVACCHRAAAIGVRPAMPIAEASDLIARDRGLRSTVAGIHAPADSDRNRRDDAGEGGVIEPHDFAADYDCLRKLAQWLQDHVSPMVSVETLEKKRWSGMPRHQSESLFCDLSGVVHLFGSESNLLHYIEDKLARFGLTASMAIADSPAAAWAISHRNLGEQRHGRWMMQIIPPEQTLELIQDLDVQTLRIPPETVRTLDRLGISRIGELFQLPRSGIATRLGEGIVRRMAQVTGELTEPMNIHHREAEVCAKVDLEYPTADLEILENRLSSLVDQARAGLATSQRGALGVSCRLELTDHSPQTFKVGLFAPTRDRGHLCTLLNNALHTQTLRSKVARISLDVTQAAPLRTSQSLLSESFSAADFQPPATEPAGRSSRTRSSTRRQEATKVADRATAGLIDTLSGRLGRDRVLGVRMTADPLPEKAFRQFPLTGQSRDGRTHSAIQTAVRPRSATEHLPSTHDALRRPTALLQKPLPLDPSQSSAATFPTAFRCHARQYKVMHWSGPERIETGWWSGPQQRRDYFRVVTACGQTWWVFRELGRIENPARPRQEAITTGETPSPWWLHGLFS